jgi:hypothetical protein
MSKKAAKKVEVTAEEAVEAQAKVAEESPKPAGVRCNRRATRRHTAHVPGPRRKPNYVSQAIPVIEGAEEAEAPAKPKPATKGSIAGEKPPMKFGSFDK